MRIGIDACDLATGVVGVGTVIERLLRYLDKSDQKNDYFIYQNDNKDYCVSANFYKRFANLKLYQYWSEQIYFSARSYLDKLDVFHAPIHLPPKFKLRKTKVVLTVHDLHVELDPGRYPLDMREYFGNRRIEAINSADAIVLHSDCVKEDVLSLCNIEESKIHKVLVGVKEEYLEKKDKDEIARIKQKYGLPDEFVLYVGSVEPWKRVSFLTKSFLNYKSKYNDNSLNLVVVGRSGCNATENEEVRKIAEDNEAVSWLGFVEQNDLPAIYQASQIFATGSIREGFGSIFVEAMASEKPIVAPKAAAIPETIGDAGLLYEADSIDQFCDTINILRSNSGEYERIQSNARERIKLFSWDEYGKSMQHIYEGLS